MCVSCTVCLPLEIEPLWACDCICDCLIKSAGEHQNRSCAGDETGRRERCLGSKVTRSHVAMRMLCVHFALITINLADWKEIELNGEKRSAASSSNSP